jgi:hypothetical protein
VLRIGATRKVGRNIPAPTFVVDDGNGLFIVARDDAGERRVTVGLERDAKRKP